jgi:hypothetical protein
VFFAAQSSADCITNTSGFDLLQAQLGPVLNIETGRVLFRGAFILHVGNLAVQHR